MARGHFVIRMCPRTSGTGNVGRKETMTKLWLNQIEERLNYLSSLSLENMKRSVKYEEANDMYESKQNKISIKSIQKSMPKHI